MPWVRILLVLLGTWGVAAPLPPITPVATLPLFNGTNLSGFSTWLVDSRGEDPRRVFQVANGLIRISGEGLGYLGTLASYCDYHLVVEYRWGQTNWNWGDRIGHARDAGIFLHAFGPDGNSRDGHGAFKAAIECNVFQGATGDFLLIQGVDENGHDLVPRLTSTVSTTPDGDGWPYWTQGGKLRTFERWGRLNWSHKDPHWRDLTDFRGAQDIERAPGEWNRLECICTSDRIRIRVNGTIVNEARDVSPRCGQILLQCEGSEIFFRRVELHPLAVDPTPGPPHP